MLLIITADSLWKRQEGRWGFESMCAILDTNAVPHVFGRDRPEIGQRFFEWIHSGSGRLVLGGRLREELNKTGAREWLKQAILSGRVREVADEKVESKAVLITDGRLCVSNDPHVIALAQASGARLLYSNDYQLTKDFKKKTLVDGPRGKIYPVPANGKFRKSHRQLFRRHDLCRK